MKNQIHQPNSTIPYPLRLIPSVFKPLSLLLFLLATLYSYSAAARVEITIASPVKQSPVYTTEHAHFYCLDTISASNEVMILIHGWSLTKTFDQPLAEIKNYYENEWQNFIAHFQSKHQKVCLYTWDVRNGIPTDEPTLLANALQSLHSDYGIPYHRMNLIAHSQGGNYCKQALVTLSVQKQPSQQINLVTLGTPHTGSERLYLRHVAMIGETLGIIGLTTSAMYLFHNLSKNAETSKEQTLYQAGMWLSGIIGTTYLGYRASQFSEDYHYPGLLQLRALKNNPLLTHLNNQIVQLGLNQTISAIYTDYQIIGGDIVVPTDSGAWKGVQLKNRQQVSNRSHLDLINGDAEIFTYLDEILF
jgi:hypothetical protein